jgi:orotidine-5'-phosphate decarboxylase
MSNPIIVALDIPSKERAIQLVEELAPVIGTFKIGSELFTSAGPEIVRAIRSTGASVFLDLKFHDIPNTVAKAAAAATRLDVQWLTLHTSGGLSMMQAAQLSVTDTAQKLGIRPPLLLGVTVLTSLSSGELGEVGQDSNVGKQVERLANLTVKAGLRGLVCSPLELVGLRQLLPGDMQLITPGIRTSHEEGDDQKRTLSAREALDAGANLLVIGRPITAAPSPRKAAEVLLESLTR